MPLVDGLVRHGIRTYYDVMAPVLRPSRERRVAGLVKEGLPEKIQPMINYLISGEADPETMGVSDKMERIRARLAADGFRTINLIEGKRSMARVARTGKGKRWGTALHILAKSARSANILELGACAGISGGYLASSPYCTRFITIEGSTDLSEIARGTIAEVASNAEVINALFDEGLNRLLPSLKSIDLVFIDGHHEKEATFHYYNRIAPALSDDAVVVFDDISWTADMRDMWNTIVLKPEFSHAFDFGEVGICFRGRSGRQHYWDMQPVTGRMLVV